MASVHTKNAASTGHEFPKYIRCKSTRGVATTHALSLLRSSVLTIFERRLGMQPGEITACGS